MNEQQITMMDTGQRIDSFLAQTGLVSGHPRVVPLTPDASDRRYFRVLQDDAEPIVLAVYTGPIEFERMPFASVVTLLHRMNIPVPAVLGHSDQLGIVAQQDLGDVTLQAHLAGASVSDHLPLYREAVELVHQLQSRGRQFAQDGYVPYTLAFDVEKLTFEFDFFTRHFLEGHRSVRLTATERAALSHEWSTIATELAGEERVLCHRDYHSRNLMLHAGRLYMVDFQDARLGPDTYDLVSLLRDSYVDVTEQEVDALISWYLELSAVADAGEFRRRFDLMAVQRNIKALGTFGFQASARGNAAYIQYMPRTLNSVRANLTKHTRFARLQSLLGAYVEELR
jgi:N-acetylmuramate 1-kinase